MSLPLLHPPAEILRQLLVDRGVGTDSDATPLGAWPVYANGEPSRPDEAITVYDTSPVGFGWSQADGEQLRHLGLQFRVRAATPGAAFRKAEALRVTLNEGVYRAGVWLADPTGATVAAGYRVWSVAAGELLDLWKNVPGTKRSVLTVNTTAPVERCFLSTPPLAPAEAFDIIVFPPDGSAFWTNPLPQPPWSDTAPVTAVLAAGQRTDELSVQGFSAGVPTGATVLGIAVRFRWRGAGANETEVAVGTSGAHDRTRGAALPAAFAWSDWYGGPADLWGQAWTPATVNGIGLDVTVRFLDAGAGSTVDLSAVQAAVYYAPP